MAINKKTPGINGSSMADISFILFIFFLMVTTMGTDYGLIRQLPPWVEHNPDDTGDKINQRNVFVVSINQSNDMLVQNEYRTISDLRAKAKEFYDINNTGDRFPEKEMREISLVGAINVNRTAVVSLQNDRGTAYRVYIQAQNELAGAINELRDEFCMQYFGSRFDDCTEEQRDVVSREVYPMSISEAEPKNVSKTN